MAALPSTKRITQEELQGSADQKIETMVRPINLFFDGIWSALNRGLTVDENMDAQILKVRFKTNEDYPVVSKWKPVYFSHELKKQPQGVSVLQLQKVDSIREIHSNPVWADVKFELQQGKIDYITGLQPCTSYDIVLLIL